MRLSNSPLVTVEGPPAAPLPAELDGVPGRTTTRARSPSGRPHCAHCYRRLCSRPAAPSQPPFAAARGLATARSSSRQAEVRPVQPASRLLLVWVSSKTAHPHEVEAVHRLSERRLEARAHELLSRNRGERACERGGRQPAGGFDLLRVELPRGHSVLVSGRPRAGSGPRNAPAAGQRDDAGHAGHGRLRAACVGGSSSAYIGGVPLLRGMNRTSPAATSRLSVP